MMKTNLVGKYIKVGYGDNIVYNEIVAVYAYHGQLHFVARNPDYTLYDQLAMGCVVVDKNSIPARYAKCSG